MNPPIAGTVTRARTVSRPGNSSRFTLIELLVVIAIIAILAALLLPALQKARDKARTILCANTMREFTVATQLYVDDYQFAWPGWQYALAPFRGLLETGYIKSDLMICPSRETTRTRSYSVNAFIYYRGWRKITEVLQPSNTLYIVEEHEDSIDNEHFAVRNNLWWNMIAARHTRGANMTFCDGHVEYWSWSDPRTGIFTVHSLSEMNNADLDRINRAQCPPYIP